MRRGSCLGSDTNGERLWSPRGCRSPFRGYGGYGYADTVDTVTRALRAATRTGKTAIGGDRFAVGWTRRFCRTPRQLRSFAERLDWFASLAEEGLAQTAGRDARNLAVIVPTFGEHRHYSIAQSGVRLWN